jgi:hypothetical protein
VGTLPEDVLSAIFSRVPTGDARVARRATTCKRWGRIVAESAAAIARTLPRPCTRLFLPHLAVGILHGPEDGTARTRRKIVVAVSRSGQPHFVSMASASLRLEDDGMFDYARLVASRNGRVAFKLLREVRGDGLTLFVCNPMTADVAVLPPLASDDFPGYYACTMLTGDDLDLDVVPPRCCSSGFFRLLLVYNRRNFTVLRCYSSNAGRWGPEARKPDTKMSSRML